MPKVSALLRCGSCRFTAFYFLSFYIALLDSGHGSWRWVLFGAFFWSLNSLGTELTNRLSDRIEDRINRPERTALCDQIGFSQIKKLCVLIWSTLFAVDLIWIWLRPNLNLAILLLLGLLAGVNYSYGLRFKNKKYLSLFALTFPFGGPFLIGWSAYNPLPAASDTFLELIHRGGPVVLVLGFFIASLAGVKDITDVPGDEQVGYQSLWVSLVRNHSTALIFLVVATPFMILSFLLLTEMLPLRFAVLLLVFPLSWSLALCVRLARTSAQQQALREILYHYWFCFLCLALFLYVPTVAAAATILGVAAYWIVTSQYLHWSNGLRLWKVQTISILLRQHRQRTQVT
jgi:4-hydroxybenzoate polyprenyltransferase